ncbi:hypothetical protein Cus16_0497 [Curtobacterium sp. ER1/6]|nr:hypothetical protein Cus16_0497 [Curtobacterium sp. ER1/6]
MPRVGSGAPLVRTTLAVTNDENSGERRSTVLSALLACHVPLNSSKAETKRSQV